LLFSSLEGASDEKKPTRFRRNELALLAPLTVVDGSAAIAEEKTRQEVLEGIAQRRLEAAQGMMAFTGKDELWCVMALEKHDDDLEKAVDWAFCGHASVAQLDAEVAAIKEEEAAVAAAGAAASKKGGRAATKVAAARPGALGRMGSSRRAGGRGFAPRPLRRMFSDIPRADLDLLRTQCDAMGVPLSELGAAMALRAEDSGGQVDRAMNWIFDNLALIADAEAKAEAEAAAAAEKAEAIAAARKAASGDGGDSPANRAAEALSMELDPQFIDPIAAAPTQPARAIELVHASFGGVGCTKKLAACLRADPSRTSFDVAKAPSLFGSNIAHNSKKHLIVVWRQHIDAGSDPHGRSSVELAQLVAETTSTRQEAHPRGGGVVELALPRPVLQGYPGPIEHDQIIQAMYGSKDITDVVCSKVEDGAFVFKAENSLAGSDPNQGSAKQLSVLFWRRDGRIGVATCMEGGSITLRDATTARVMLTGYGLQTVYPASSLIEPHRLIRVMTHSAGRLAEESARLAQEQRRADAKEEARSAVAYGPVWERLNMAVLLGDSSPPQWCGRIGSRRGGTRVAGGAVANSWCPRLFAKTEANFRDKGRWFRGDIVDIRVRLSGGASESLLQSMRPAATRLIIDATLEQVVFNRMQQSPSELVRTNSVCVSLAREAVAVKSGAVAAAAIARAMAQAEADNVVVLASARWTADVMRAVQAVLPAEVGRACIIWCSSEKAPVGIAFDQPIFLVADPSTFMSSANTALIKLSALSTVAALEAHADRALAALPSSAAVLYDVRYERYASDDGGARQYSGAPILERVALVRLRAPQAPKLFTLRNRASGLYLTASLAATEASGSIGGSGVADAVAFGDNPTDPNAHWFVVPRRDDPSHSIATCALKSRDAPAFGGTTVTVRAHHGGLHLMRRSPVASIADATSLVAVAIVDERLLARYADRLDALDDSEMVGHSAVRFGMQVKAAALERVISFYEGDVKALRDTVKRERTVETKYAACDAATLKAHALPREAELLRQSKELSRSLARAAEYLAIQLEHIKLLEARRPTALIDLLRSSGEGIASPASKAATKAASRAASEAASKAESPAAKAAGPQGMPPPMLQRQVSYTDNSLIHAAGDAIKVQQVVTRHRAPVTTLWPGTSASVAVHLEGATGALVRDVTLEPQLLQPGTRTADGRWQFGELPEYLIGCPFFAPPPLPQGATLAAAATTADNSMEVTIGGGMWRLHVLVPQPIAAAKASDRTPRAMYHTRAEERELLPLFPLGRTAPPSTAALRAPAGGAERGSVATKSATTAAEHNSTALSLDRVSEWNEAVAYDYGEWWLGPLEFAPGSTFVGAFVAPPAAAPCANNTLWESTKMSKNVTTRVQSCDFISLHRVSAATQEEAAAATAALRARGGDAGDSLTIASEIKVSVFMYRYILRESCSQFDSLPLTYSTISPPAHSRATWRKRCAARGGGARGGARSLRARSS
jgi:hypothetical protein